LLINKKILRFPLRFFFTSRPEPRCSAIFGDTDNILYYNLHDFKPDSDIRFFLEHKLRAIRQERKHIMSGISTSWPSNDEADSLLKKSSGSFVYASTAVKFIGDKYTVGNRPQTRRGH
jgi:hypothetical protein